MQWCSKISVSAWRYRLYCVHQNISPLKVTQYIIIIIIIFFYLNTLGSIDPEG